MSNITNYLNKVKTAIYGKDVRGAIHDAIKQVYDDASVDHDNANMEVKLARGTHNTLNDRLDNVDEIQAQTNAQLSQIDDRLYDGFFIKLKNLTGVKDHREFTSDDYYTMYNSLCTDTRFSFRDLGKDQSGEYNIRMYIYEPTNYQSTLFITCAVHGWEHYTSYIMYLFFKMLLDDEKLPPQLNTLRSTRILCIPCSNPWGMHADGASGTNATRRGNSRGVDLNRNFDYRWEQNSGNFGLSKGESAFSEVETQYIRDVMESYNIVHYLDFHSFYKSSSEKRDYLFYGNQEAKDNTNQMIKWLKQAYGDLNIEHTVTEDDSSANNYANRIRSIPSMNIEMIMDASNDFNLEARKWLELTVNYLNLQANSHQRSNPNTKFGCKLTQRPNSGETYSITNGWSEVPGMSISYKVDVDGIMMVNGWLSIIIEGGDSSTTVTLSPYIQQPEFYTIKSSGSRAKPYFKQSNGVAYIPFNCTFFARKGYGNVEFKLEVILEGAGSATIKRKDATYLFMPCDNSYLQLGQHNKVVPW